MSLINLSYYVLLAFIVLSMVRGRGKNRIYGSKDIPIVTLLIWVENLALELIYDTLAAPSLSFCKIIPSV